MVIGDEIVIAKEGFEGMIGKIVDINQRWDFDYFTIELNNDMKLIVYCNEMISREDLIKRLGWLGVSCIHNKNPFTMPLDELNKLVEWIESKYNK